MKNRSGTPRPKERGIGIGQGHSIEKDGRKENRGRPERAKRERNGRQQKKDKRRGLP